MCVQGKTVWDSFAGYSDMAALKDGAIMILENGQHTRPLTHSLTHSRTHAPEPEQLSSGGHSLPTLKLQSIYSEKGLQSIGGHG